MKALSAEQLGFSYDSGLVLSGISFDLNQGEIIGVIGPNGSGKSTLIRLLSGVLKPDSGKIIIFSKAIASYSRKELAQKLAVIPQQTELAFPYRVLEVVLMGRAPYLSRFQLESAKDLEIALQALSQTGCLGLESRRIDEVSGGERQRVILAKALAQEPEIILADEPTAHLDLEHQIKFMRLISELREKRKISVLFTTHDLNLASIFADRILVLDQGRLAGLGTPKEVLKPELMSKIYHLKLKQISGIYQNRPFLIPEPELANGE